jgi:RND superfamily putative drug exporter
MKRGVPYVIAFVLDARLRPAAGRVQVDRRAGEGDRAQPALVGRSYGLLVLVFQHHWAEPILGFKSNGSIISVAAALPLRRPVRAVDGLPRLHPQPVREAVDGGMPTDDAVRYGITATAGVVTSAALVMVGVFSLFGSLSSLDVKQAGVGLAAAVLIDATIVRAVLLPSSMRLLGERNWYLPPFLRRLPKLPMDAPPAGEAS